MPDNLNQKALLSIDLDVKGLNQQAAEAKKKVQDLSDQLKILKVTGKENTEEYILLQGQMKAYQQTVNQAVQVNRQLAISEKAAKGSIDDISASLAIVTRQYNSLSAEERDNTQAGKDLLKQQRTLSDSYKGLKAAGGDNTPNVGNYKDALGQANQAQQVFAEGTRGVIEGFANFSPITSKATAVISALVTVQRNVVTGFQSLETIQAKAVAATEADTTATRELTLAKERLAAAEAEIANLRQTEEATAVELSAANQALTVAIVELNLSQEKQLVNQVALADAQLILANRTGAVNTKTSASFFSLQNIAIASLVAIGATVYSFLKQYDSFSDGLEQDIARIKAGFTQLGAAITGLFTGKGFEGFSKIRQAADDAAKFTDQLQNIQDLQDINDNSNKKVQNEVDLYRIMAKNRKLDADGKQYYLDLADKKEKEQFDKTKNIHKQAIDELVDYVNKQNETRKFSNFKLQSLTVDELNQLKAGNVATANALLNKNQITKANYLTLKGYYDNQINDQQIANSKLEKINNAQDQYAEKAAAKAEAARAEKKRLQNEADKSNEVRKNSIIATAAFNETQRQKEEESINIDYDKKVFANRKYSATVEQLELERQAALKNLRQKFALEDAKTQNEYDNLLYKGKEDALKTNIERIKKIQDGGTLENQHQALDDIEKLHQLQVAQNAENEALDLSQKDLTEQQKTNIEEKYHQLSITNEQAYEQSRLDLITDLSAKRIAQYQKERDAIAVIEKSKRDIYSAGSQLIIDIFGKNTAIGKAALVIQKSLAIAEVVINTQKQVAAIELAGAYQSAAASLTVFGIFTVPGIIAATQVRATIAEIQGALQIAAIVATAISGFSKGGMFVSDGRGAQLPGYSPVDNVNARLRDGEIVLVPGVGKDPFARQLASALNVAHGGRAFASGYVPLNSGFADGGVFSTQFAVPNYQTLIQQTADATAIAVAQNTPRQVLVVQDVESKLNDNQRVRTRQNI